MIFGNEVESNLIDFVFTAIFYDYDESPECDKNLPDLTDSIIESGEHALKNVLIFLYNSCIKNQTLWNNFILEMDRGSVFIYRVHRYIYISEEYCKEEDEEMSEIMLDLCSWYKRII